MILVAAADKHGYVYHPNGIDALGCISTYQSLGSVGYLEPFGKLITESVEELISASSSVDAYFLALPNLPNNFIQTVVKQFIKLGKISTHTFTLGDETSMAANVCGPAFGYLKAGIQLHKRSIHGIFTAAEIMPQFVK